VRALLAFAVAAAFLVFAAPASANLSNVKVSFGDPSTAAGAKTRYVIDLHTNAALSSGAGDRFTLNFPAGTGLGQQWDSTIKAGAGPDIGGCFAIDADSMECTISQPIPAGSDVEIIVAGLLNPSTIGSKTITAFSTAETTPVPSSSYTVTAAQAAALTTVALSDPSPAAGAKTTWALNLQTSSTGKLDYHAGSFIDLTLPAGTVINDLWDSHITVGAGPDLGGCFGTGTETMRCTLNFDQSIPASTAFKITIDGIKNPPAGSGKSVIATTSSDITTDPSNLFTVTAAQAPTLTNVAIADPSSAAAAKTTWVLDMQTSSTGKLDYHAGSFIELTLPAGTVINDLWDSHITVGAGPDLGGCFGTGTETMRCTLNFDQSIPASTAFKITIDGIKNPPAGAGKTISAKTSSDVTTDSSNPFAVTAAQAPALTNVAIADPSSAAGARTRWVLDMHTSATGKLDYHAGSFFELNVPTGTSLNSLWDSHITVGAGTDLGGCFAQDADTLRCTLHFDASIPADTDFKVTVEGLFNPPQGTGKTVTTTTSSDVNSDASNAFSVGAAQAVTAVTVIPTSSAGGATADYNISFHTSSTGEVEYDTGGTITFTLPAGTGFSQFAGGTVAVAGGPDIGNCSNTAATTVVRCFLDFGETIPANTNAEVTLIAVTNPPSGTAGKTLTATTTSDTVTATSSAFGTGVDNTAPNTTITGGPSGSTSETRPTFTFSSSETPATFQCQIDAAPFVACNSGSFTTPTLADGGHTFRVMAKDAAGNEDASPASRAFTVSTAPPPDTTPPPVSIDSAPSGDVADPTPSFAFSSSEAGVSFACQLDASGFSPCSSPYTAPELAEGQHTFTLRATDPAGNSTETRHTFAVAVPEPRKTVNVAPAGGTVRIKLPGSNQFVELREGEQIPVGTSIDTTDGRVTLVAAANKTGATATADFYDGIFKVGQTKGSKPITTLKLNGPKPQCGAGAAAVGETSARRRRRLWGSGSGRFRTRGRYSAATVSGTQWLTEDNCKGTLTRVEEGVVKVRDFRKDKTVTVRAGNKYLARASRG